MNRTKRGVIAFALLFVLVCGMTAPAARADVDLTGTWIVYHDHFGGPTGTELWEFTQSGTSLTLSIDGGPVASGSVTPATGAFSIDFGPAPGTCGLFAEFTAEGQAGADGVTLSERFVDVFTPAMCQPVYSFGVGTRCLNSPLDPGEECVTPEVPLFGRLLTVRDKGGDSSKRKIVLKLVGPTFAAPAPDSLEDPRGSSTLHHTASLGGARIEIARGMDESTTVELPAVGWQGLGNPPGSQGYRYVDPQQQHGSCTRAIVRDGLIKATCKGSGLGFSLDEASQGALTASFQLGRIFRPACSLFGGTVLSDTQAAMGSVGVFRAKNAGAPASCTPP